MGYEVFISYETQTGKSYAEHLKEALERYGYHSFHADLSIDKGDWWRDEIDSALESCKYFVVVITTLTLDSKEVIREYERAVKSKKRIIPCRWKKIKISETKDLSKIQQIEFEDKCELANEVIFELKKKKEMEIEIEEDADEFISRGNLLKDLKRFSEAEKEYRKAITINPDFVAEAHNNLGSLLKDLKRFSEAEKEYREAIRINPGLAEAHNNLGLLLYKLNRFDEAEKEWREAIRINPDYAKAHNNLWSLLYKLNRFDEAEKELRKAITINPDYAEAHGNLGSLFLKTERPEDAKKELKIAKDLFEKQGKEEYVKKVDGLLEIL